MKQQGFTLIELLVSIGILLIMFGLGLVNYLDFQDRQKMKEARLTVKEAVADAQSSARSGRIGSCQTLQFYRIEFVASANQGVINIVTDCVNDGNNSTASYNLPSGVTFDQDYFFYAMPVNGVVDDDGDVNTKPIESTEVHMTGNSNSNYTFNISRSGTVSMGS